jgi:hypothetical protein
MTKKLAVTVAVDVDTPAVTLKPAGVLTDDNVKGLVAIAHRAERLMPDCDLHVETTRLLAVSPGALRVLSEAGIETTEAPPLGGRGVPQPEQRQDSGHRNRKAIQDMGLPTG